MLGDKQSFGGWTFISDEYISPNILALEIRIVKHVDTVGLVY